MKIEITESKHSNLLDKYIRVTETVNTEDLEIVEVKSGGRIAKSCGIDYMIAVIGISVNIKDSPVSPPEHPMVIDESNSASYFRSYGGRSLGVCEDVKEKGYVFYFFHREPLRKSKVNCRSCNKKIGTSTIEVLDHYVKENEALYTKEKMLAKVTERFLSLVSSNNRQYLEDHLSTFIKELSGSGLESLRAEMEDFNAKVSVNVYNKDDENRRWR